MCRSPTAAPSKKTLSALAGDIRPAGNPAAGKSSWRNSSSMPKFRPTMYSPTVSSPTRAAVAAHVAPTTRTQRECGGDARTRDTPARNSASAVFPFIVAQPGTPLVNSRMSMTQPIKTSNATNATAHPAMRDNIWAREYVRIDSPIESKNAV